MRSLRLVAAISTTRRWARSCSRWQRWSNAFAAPTASRAQIRTNGSAVGPETALRFHAPVRGRVVRVVKRQLLWIRTGGHVHALVTEFHTVHAGRQLRRRQVIHGVLTPSSVPPRAAPRV